jgi:hypothetical protein
MDERHFDQPDPALLAPIEDEFWTENGIVPTDASVAVRGAPITADKFLAHAVRQAREYSFRGANMASLSVDLGFPTGPWTGSWPGNSPPTPDTRPARSWNSEHMGSRWSRQGSDRMPTLSCRRSLSWRLPG